MKGRLHLLLSSVKSCHLTILFPFITNNKKSIGNNPICVNTVNWLWRYHQFEFGSLAVLLPSPYGFRLFRCTPFGMILVLSHEVIWETFLANFLYPPMPCSWLYLIVWSNYCCGVSSWQWFQKFNLGSQFSVLYISLISYLSFGFCPVSVVWAVTI